MGRKKSKANVNIKTCRVKIGERIKEERKSGGGETSGSGGSRGGGGRSGGRRWGGQGGVGGRVGGCRHRGGRRGGVDVDLEVEVEVDLEVEVGELDQHKLVKQDHNNTGLRQQHWHQPVSLDVRGTESETVMEQGGVNHGAILRPLKQIAQVTQMSMAATDAVASAVLI